MKATPPHGRPVFWPGSLLTRATPASTRESARGVRHESSNERLIG